MDKSMNNLEETNERLNAILDHVPEIFYMSDLKGNFIDGNKTAEKIIGYKKEELIGKNFLKLKILSPGQIPKAAKLLAKNALGLSTGPDEFTLTRKDGSTVIVELSTHPLKIGKRTMVLSMGRDISDRKSAEKANLEAIEKAEEINQRLILLNEISNIFLTIEDKKIYGEVIRLILNYFESKHGFFGYLDQDGALVCPSLDRGMWSGNKRAGKINLFPPDKWGGIWGRTLKEKKTFCSNEPFNVPRGHIPMKRALSTPIIYGNNAIGIIIIGNKDKDYTFEDIILIENISNFISPVLQARLQRNIEEIQRKKLEKQLMFISLHDKLTHVYNRTYFEEELSRLQESRDFPVSMISIDVDELKLINDNLGHITGDKLINVCVSAVKKAIRKSDVFARIGGDEFIVILPGTDQDIGNNIIKRIKKETELYNSKDGNLPLSLSVGLATSHKNTDLLIDTYIRSDEAMYDNKELHKKAVRTKVKDYLSKIK